jgi:polyisoprenoid-binding protein YceI
VIARLPATPAWLRIAVLLVFVAGVAGGGYGLWTVFLKPAGPAAVDASTVSVPTASASATTSGSPLTSGDGTWLVNASIGSFDDFSGSFVGYRVQEELATIGGNTAVGRTPDVTGSLTLDGTTVTSVEVTADLTTLVSDDDRRDGQLRQQSLETSQFPTATFTLTDPTVLPDGAAGGETVSVTASGELTLHGVTQQVEIPLEARLDGETIVVTGSIEIAFADYQIEKPTSFALLSVDDHGTMEFQLFFNHE